jgi:outer membrane protein OmpA-like peptidoglycan-associated protein
MRFPVVLVALFALCSLYAPAAVAQVEGLPIGYGVQFDATQISFTVEAFDALSDVDLVLTRRADGRAFRFDRSALDTGATWTVDIPLPARTSEIQVRVEATFAGERGYLTDAFEVEVLADMDFEVDLSTYDGDARRFMMTMTQPAGHVELTVRGDQGDIVAERVIPFDGESPGTPLLVTWTQPNVPILTIDVKAVGQSGSWSSRQYVPWEVAFDAVFVHFASGSSEIPATDVGVLRERLAQIMATADRVSEWVEVKLYIAGYTDTVGSPADNQRLSEARARSIGAFFRTEGVSFPIYYQGFGESALAVETEDNVDEPENRRSTFILATNPPATSSAIPRGNWQRL